MTKVQGATVLREIGLLRAIWTRANWESGGMWITPHGPMSSSRRTTRRAR